MTKKYPLDGPNQEWHAGYEAGLKEGARRERRALISWLPGSLVYRERIVEWAKKRNKLASRQRKGGKK